MIKYYEIYFINFTGETISVVVEVDISDVCDFLMCNIITLDESMICRYIMHLFVTNRPNDEFCCVVPYDFIDSPLEPIPFEDVIYNPLPFY